ncbi:oligosaccharide repeat unit polymerase [Rossellomorea vietnamensis]|nr:oligosaccharide repeat unit polymerase [Rossellomorea vietnamensis]
MSAIVFLLDSIQLIYGLSIIIILIIICIQFLGKFKARLILVWQGAFIYIVGLEGFVNHNEILVEYGNGAVYASQYIVATFFLSIIGYLIGYNLDNIKKNALNLTQTDHRTIEYKSSVFTVLFLIIMYCLFILLNFNNAIDSFYGGRNTQNFKADFSFLNSAINNTLSMTLPAIITFTFRYIYKIKNCILVSAFLSFPVFTILFLQGTRFTLLFSLAGLILVSIQNKKIKFKNIIYIALIGFVTLYVGELMRDSRGIGIVNYLSSNGKQIKDSMIELFYSKEGITGAMTMLIEYYEGDFNFHKYGASTGFIFIFWIPRILWPDKPTMLGHWLIRELPGGGFSGGHSRSFGFAGDAYVDFGLIGGIVFALIFGLFIQFLERRNKKIFINNYNVLYIAITYPFVFFAFRSLQTSFMNFLGMLVILWIFKKTLVTKNYKN